MSEADIANVKTAIEGAPIVVYNPSRNALVYLSDVSTENGERITVSFDVNNILHGEIAHGGTSIHTRASYVPLLEKLGTDAKIIIKNKNKLDTMLSGNQVQSLKLLAKIEFDDDTVTQGSSEVKQDFSEASADTTTSEEKREAIAKLEAEIDDRNDLLDPASPTYQKDRAPGGSMRKPGTPRILKRPSSIKCESPVMIRISLKSKTKTLIWMFLHPDQGLLGGGGEGS